MHGYSRRKPGVVGISKVTIEVGECSYRLIETALSLSCSCLMIYVWFNGLNSSNSDFANFISFLMSWSLVKRKPRWDSFSLYPQHLPSISDCYSSSSAGQVCSRRLVSYLIQVVNIIQLISSQVYVFFDRTSAFLRSQISISSLSISLSDSGIP